MEKHMGKALKILRGLQTQVQIITVIALTIF